MNAAMSKSYSKLVSGCSRIALQRRITSYTWHQLGCPVSCKWKNFLTTFQTSLLQTLSAMLTYIILCWMEQAHTQKLDVLNLLYSIQILCQNCYVNAISLFILNFSFPYHFSSGLSKREYPLCGYTLLVNLFSYFLDVYNMLILHIFIFWVIMLLYYMCIDVKKQ